MFLYSFHYDTDIIKIVHYQNKKKKGLLKNRMQNWLHFKVNYM